MTIKTLKMGEVGEVATQTFNVKGFNLDYMPGLVLGLGEVNPTPWG